MKCSKCQNEVSLSDKFCENCGTARPRRICPCCQSEHDSKPVFCPKTGKNIADAKKVAEKNQQMNKLVAQIKKEKRRQPKWIIFLISVIIIAVVLSFLTTTGLIWIIKPNNHVDKFGIWVTAGTMLVCISINASVAIWDAILSRKSRREAERRAKGL